MRRAIEETGHYAPDPPLNCFFTTAVANLEPDNLKRQSNEATRLLQAHRNHLRNFFLAVPFALHIRDYGRLLLHAGARRRPLCRQVAPSGST